MALKRYQQIERGILQKAIAGGSTTYGHAISLSELVAFFRVSIPDVENKEVAAALQRLSPKYLVIWKMNNKLERFDLQAIKDEDFLYSHTLHLQATEHSDSYLQDFDDSAQSALPTGTQPLLLIAESRVDELRNLTSNQFDFKKLIRLCEEINSSFINGNYFATAMLIRTLLDHVPPLFGMNSFSEVANNYGGGKSFQSFKGTMQHLQTTARSVADGHLHQQIRKSETLPTAQQVNCAQQLDTLLAEIVRIKP
jgi:hypothetical protein